MSEHHASILGNLVAVALSLVGPKLWILFKAFFLGAIAVHKRTPKQQPGLPANTADLPLTSRTSFARYPRQSQLLNAGADRRHFFGRDHLDLTETSHSELGAALALIGNVCQILTPGRIRLSNRPSNQRRMWPVPQGASIIWVKFLQRPFDVVVSLFLSALFVGIFVAQSTADVLSANIVSDTTASVSSPNCNLRRQVPWDSDALDYSRKCYRARLGADGCTSFYNQIITYKERLENACPFPGQTCARKIDSAFTLDTGLIDAKFLGINSVERFQFRRTSTCAPLRVDGEYVKKTGLKDGLVGYEFFGREMVVYPLDYRKSGVKFVNYALSH